ncbi:hypothetical protein JX265_005967 [Neoarthrinium moseri]|uniref:Uncharacterized protein n=1 Tax=Neoarthrinium moseri TaxID=1658444 RepID=A0A9P9WMZ7_9PEZI|nr:hypothetical protein JX265_005967 [Neoarthrinium moseri]
MLYDLNIAWSPSTSSAELTRILKFSASLGYNVVALNHTLTVPISGTPTNPLPKFPPGPSSGPSTTTSSSRQHQQQDDAPLLPTVLHRATVPLHDTSVGHRLPQIAAQYDVVAVRPTNEKAFQAACLSVALEHASLISLDLAQQLDFHFRPTQCMAAVKRGMRFEVCYAQVLGVGGDARARAAFIGNLMQLVRATRGRGIVVSSETRSVVTLRGPADVVNLLAVWGLPAEKGKEALGVNPRGVVVNEGIKRSAFRGVVDIVQVAGREDRTGDKMEGVEQQAVAAPKERNQKKGDDEGVGNNGQKRKGNEGSGQGDAPISRRQAKKLKKLAVLEGNPAESKA